ncbi:hypothetical protein CYY_001532 [Polysphondylium violaceum]|uniref:Uncharacterized protein n=1 Tax=Polysphondylium violaceum TaxID=133409 RepID=A0A8J4V7T9_9MYCE|nr:hypothetical protein CYY_001532 [Polysphondylium violaceum]
MTGSWVFFALGALSAKSLAVVEGSWRYLGGASIVFHGIKTYVFGKLVRTIEYPDGEMVSIIIRRNNLEKLKSEIIRHQPALFPGVELSASDVKFLSRWTPPHFTEPCLKNKDLKLIADGGVVFWSRFDPIPKRGVTLDIKDKDHIKLDQAINFISKLGKYGTVEEALRLTENQENALIDLLLEKDEAILALHRNFSPYPHIFRYHALRYLQNKKGIPLDPFKPQQQQTTNSKQQQQQQPNSKTDKEKEKEKENQTDTKTATKAPSPTDLNAAI